MKREPWAIGNSFAYAIRILNSIFCRHPKKEGWTEDDVEASNENTWLVAEQINSMCSDMMIEDAQDMLKMVQSMPSNRLCEKVDCIYHHPENPHTHNFNGLYDDTCKDCVCNDKCKTLINHYQPKTDGYKIPAN